MVDPAAGSGFTGQTGEVHLKTAQQLEGFGRAASVRVFVQDTGAGGSVVLRIGDRTVLATTTLPLRKGEWYLARLERSAGEVTLRIQTQVSRGVAAHEVARAAGLPQDAVAEAVVRAFIRTELPLTPDRLLRAYRRLSAPSREDGRGLVERARLLAIAEGKGLDLPDGIVDAIAGSGGHGGSGGHRPGDRRGSGGRDSARSPSPVTEEDVRGAFRLGDEATHPLQLFNHIVGDGDHWVIVPISAPGTGLSASLRIRVPRQYALGADRTGASVREAVLVAEAGGNRWVFGITPAGRGLRTTLVSGPEIPGEALHELTVRLSKWGLLAPVDQRFEVDDDGFSQHGTGDIMTSVDSSA